jgi:hypothetical protein
MEKSIKKLLENNKNWVAEQLKAKPGVLMDRML